MFDAITGFLAKPLQTVLDRIIPDKNKQKEFQHEFNMEVLKESANKGKDFANRIIAEMKHPNWFRDAVRPLITYFSFGLYAYIKITVVYVATKVYLPLLRAMLDGAPQEVYERLDKIKGLLVEFSNTVFTTFDFYLLLTVFSFWFGGKLMERFAEKATGVGGIKSMIFGGR